jgi:hypothetical protein
MVEVSFYKKEIGSLEEVWDRFQGVEKLKESLIASVGSLMQKSSSELVEYSFLVASDQEELDLGQDSVFIESDREFENEDLGAKVKQLRGSNPNCKVWILPKSNIVKILDESGDYNKFESVWNTFEAAFDQEKAQTLATTLTQILSKKLEE